jgi:hypothetical protein
MLVEKMKISNVNYGDRKISAVTFTDKDSCETFLFTNLNYTIYKIENWYSLGQEIYYCVDKKHIGEDCNFMNMNF